MLRFIQYSVLGLALTLIAACTSTPQKPVVLPSAMVAQLYMTPLPEQLPVPVSKVKTRQLQDTWGASRSNGRLHEGIDIMAPRGTKVYSTTSGLVADLRDNSLGGLVVWILGPAGSWHYYAHLDEHKRGLKVGDYIEAGDLLGYVGNSGNARHTASHLHYAIYLQGKGRGAVNPFPYLH